MRDPTWAPKVEDYSQVLLEQNPWSFNGEVPSVLVPPVSRALPRCLTNRVKSDDPHRFQLILGPRRVGKTTAMYQMVQNLLRDGVSRNRLWWLRMDHPLLMELSLGAVVKSILSGHKATAEEPTYLFLDELVYAKDWDRWLKTFYDEHWAVRIVGTSSSTAALRDRMLESGVGRWEEQYLQPYLFTEFLALVKQDFPVEVLPTLGATVQALAASAPMIGPLADWRRRYLFTGGFPEILSRHADPSKGTEEEIILLAQRTLRSDAVERALYKDIPQAFGIENPILLERVLYALAGQVCGILSPKTLTQNLAGLNQPTLDRYLGYLERAFIVFTLPNFGGGELNRQRRGRKVYFVDGAVRNAALQRGLGPLRDTNEQGLLTENLLAGHFHALAQQLGVRLYHWRDGDLEVDLVLDHPSEPFAVEVGLSPRHDLGNLRRFVERFPRFKGNAYLTSPGAPYVPASSSNNGIGMIPLDMLLLAVGAQVGHELEKRVGGMHPVL
jgi:predicted AAA+ superfamily ATPase